MTKQVIAIAAVLALGACSPQINYVMAEYGKTNLTNFIEPMTGKHYRIFYNQGASKLMITPSLGEGVKKGLTFGAYQYPPEEVYSNATVSWLKSQGRSCEVTSVSLLLEPQYEVQFHCR